MDAGFNFLGEFGGDSTVSQGAQYQMAQPSVSLCDFNGQQIQSGLLNSEPEQVGHKSLGLKGSQGLVTQ